MQFPSQVFRPEQALYARLSIACLTGKQAIALSCGSFDKIPFLLQGRNPLPYGCSGNVQGFADMLSRYIAVPGRGQQGKNIAVVNRFVVVCVLPVDNNASIIRGFW